MPGGFTSDVGHASLSGAGSLSAKPSSEAEGRVPQCPEKPETLSCPADQEDPECLASAHPQTEEAPMNTLKEWKPKSHWDDHPDYPASDWKDEVSDNNTRQSYVDWVNSQIELNQEEN